jgi:hypothetical protein
MVAQVCNPSYLGGGEKEVHDSRPAQAKIALPRPHLNSKLSMVAYNCHSTYIGGIHEKITTQAKNVRTHLKNS